MNLQTAKLLNNQVEIPLLGLGVYQSKDGDETANAVKWAIEAGYRHIDTAAVYGNEEGVGKGIRESGVDRKKLFVTSKLWNEDMRQHRQREAFEESLKRLGTDYLDLYLIHWPVPGVYKESWKVLEELYKEGKVRAIGVSNFQRHHIDDLLVEASVLPAVNQIELSPRITQKPLGEYCRQLKIAVQAWSPLGGTGGDLLLDPMLMELAKKYGKSTAQLVLRWHLQSDNVVIPKSVHQDRILQNAQVFDFAIDAQDMAAIDAMNQNKRTGPDPDNFDF